MALCPYLLVKSVLGELVGGENGQNKLEGVVPGSLRWSVSQVLPAAVALGVAASVNEWASLAVYARGRASSLAGGGGGRLGVQPLDDIVHRNSAERFHTDALSPLFQVPDSILLVYTLPLMSWVLARVLQRSKVAAVLLIRKVLSLYAVLILLRTVTFSATVLPSPLGSCQQAHKLLEGEPPQDGTVVSSIYCYDLLFSGHTATNFLVLWLVLFSDVGMLVKLLSLFFAAAAAALSTLSRDHYTVDVVVAVVVTSLLMLLRRRELTVLLQGCVPASACGAQGQLWELWNDDDTVAAVVHAGERRIFGRREIPSRKASRQHLLVEAHANCLECTVLGKRMVELFDSDLGQFSTYATGETFLFFPDQQLALFDGHVVIEQDQEDNHVLTLVGK